MKRKTIVLLILIVASAACLSACEKKRSATKDVQRFVQITEDVGKQIIAKKTAAEKEKADQMKAHTTYHASTLRDPFEVPVISKTAKQYPNLILKNFALDSLKLVGIVVHARFRWAIFRANDGKLYKITVGMRVGSEGSLLAKIEPEAVEFVQEMNTPSGMSTRDIVVRMQEPKQ